MSEVRKRLKGEVQEELDELEDKLRGLSEKIFDNPELKFKEYQALEWLTGTLEDRGFEVDRGVGDLETAFRARCSKSNGKGPTLAFLSEYDALPGLGHACGHNLIAVIGLGAGLGLCSVMDELDGELLVIGTPAEEGGGGKVKLLEAGVFKDVDAALMFHPSDDTLVGRGSLGVQELKMDFYGEAAHAASRPEKGINALDAAIATFNNVNALREHIKDSSRIHGIITDGGEKPNIVPEHAGALFYVRAEDLHDLEELLDEVKNCARAGGLATGAEVEISEKGHGYKPMSPNPVLADLVRQNLKELGEEIGEHEGGMGSTDMGDVSHALPAVHPYIKIAEEGTPAHSKAFADAANSEKGYRKMLTAAKALAMTGVDYLNEKSRQEAVLERFRSS